MTKLSKEIIYESMAYQGRLSLFDTIVRQAEIVKNDYPQLNWRRELEHLQLLMDIAKEFKD